MRRVMEGRIRAREAMAAAGERKKKSVQARQEIYAARIGFPRNDCLAKVPCCTATHYGGQRATLVRRRVKLRSGDAHTLGELNERRYVEMQPGSRSSVRRGRGCRVRRKDERK